MDRAGLINKVKIKLDEFTPEGVSLPFDEFIGPMLDESAKEILEKHAPLHMLTPTVLPTTGMVYSDNNKGYIPVPAGFLRLNEITFALWKRSVTKAITPDDSAYPSQQNEYLVGYARPSVVIRTTSIKGGAVTKYLECSKVVASAVPTSASYIKTARPEDLDDLLAESLSWLCASKILMIGGQGDKAKMAYEQFANSLTQS